MTKLEQLIKKFCPNGVKFEPLWKVTTWDKRFNGVDKKKQVHICKFKHVSAAQLKSMSVDNGDVLLLSTGNFTAYTSKELAGEYLNNNEVISLPSGGTATIKYTNGLFVDSSNLLCITSNKQKYNLKFIYYYLLTRQEFFDRNFRGSGIKHPNMQVILELKVPVPSIEVQTEIVKILDKFASITAELTAELTLRKKQYEFYRDKILTFKREREIMLCECTKLVAGERIIKAMMNEEGEYPVMGGGVAPTGYYSKYNFQNSVTISRAGSAGFVNWMKEKFWATDVCFVSSQKQNGMLIKFVYHYVKSKQNELMKKVYGGNLPKLDKKYLWKLPIPLISFEKQHQIVKVLDSFESYLNDIQSGLPAEIALRQKQYEYYRNKLLTFKELRD